MGFSIYKLPFLVLLKKGDDEMSFNLSVLFYPAIIIGVVVLIIMSITTMWKRVPQDKALVITGLRKRVISGGGGFVIPLLERADRISLENMTIDVDIKNVLTEQGVEISVDGVAVIKVKSDEDSVLASMEQFNTGNEDETYTNISTQAKNILEGKLREIISKMSVEEAYKDREKFSSHVQEYAAVDFQKMGLEIKAFIIRNIYDRNGYLEALGKPKIASVKRDALIAEAEAQKETKVKTAEAMRLGEEAQLIAESQVAEASKNKEIRIQSYNKDQNTAKAEADLAYELQNKILDQEVQRQSMQVEIIKKEKEIELQDKEAARKEKELDATVRKQADASKYGKEKEAEAKKYTQIQEAEAEARSIEIKVIAEAQAIQARSRAEAEAVKILGFAEAEAIEAKGKAEAEAMSKKAEAFKLYNEAAVTQMIVERLPEIARAISEPLSKTEKIVIVDNGNGEGGNRGASKVTGYVNDIISQLPESVKALTGLDLSSMLEKTNSATSGDQ